MICLTSQKSRIHQLKARDPEDQIWENSLNNTIPQLALIPLYPDPCMSLKDTRGREIQCSGFERHLLLAGPASGEQHGHEIVLCFNTLLWILFVKRACNG